MILNLSLFYNGYHLVSNLVSLRFIFLAFFEKEIHFFAQIKFFSSLFSLELTMIDFEHQNETWLWQAHSYPGMIINLGAFDYWNCYYSFAGEDESTVDYWACFQMFSERRSWWNSFALTPTHCDIRFAGVRWCDGLLDVPSKGFVDNTM